MLDQLDKLHGEMTGFVDEKKTVIIVYLHFRKDFGTDSSTILIVNMKYGLDEQRAGLGGG